MATTNFRYALGCSAASSPDPSTGLCRHRTPEWSQRDPLQFVIDQGPLRRARVAQPVMFHLPLLLPRADERRRRCFTGFRYTVGFN